MMIRHADYIIIKIYDLLRTDFAHTATRIIGKATCAIVVAFAHTAMAQNHSYLPLACAVFVPYYVENAFFSVQAKPNTSKNVATYRTAFTPIG